jgi:hypothetical protein
MWIPSKKSRQGRLVASGSQPKATTGLRLPINYSPTRKSPIERNVSRPAALPWVTEHDLLNNALELLIQAFCAADEGRFAAARGLSAVAAQYFEDAEIIAAAKRRAVTDDAA